MLKTREELSKQYEDIVYSIVVDLGHCEDHTVGIGYEALDEDMARWIKKGIDKLVKIGKEIKDMDRNNPRKISHEEAPLFSSNGEINNA